jgi:flagellar hook-associated protein 1 FlgK
MNANSIASSALSALQNAQAGIDLVSQNVNGQAVAGYTRRKLDTPTERSMGSGAPVLGSGVSVNGFGREWSALLQQQRVTQAGTTAFNGTVADGLASLDSQAADATLSLDKPVNDFFTSVATLARNPKDAAALAALKTQGGVLLNAAQRYQDSITTVQRDARSALPVAVEQLNNIAAELAVINRDIAASQGSVGPSPAELDRRDALLLQAGGLVGGDLGLSADGQAYVFLGGQPLVNGGSAARLKVTPENASGKAPLALSVEFGTNGQATSPVSVSLSPDALGGSLGGQLKLASDPSLVLQPNGQPDPNLAPMTDLMSAAAGRRAAADASPLMTALSTLGAFNAKKAPTEADRVALDQSLQALAAQANSTDAKTGAGAMQATLLGGWRAFVGNLGSAVNAHKSAQMASEAVETRLNADFQSQSGVNLDEEAANLMRYQQTYSAASKLLQVNANLLDLLLAAIGR